MKLPPLRRAILAGVLTSAAIAPMFVAAPAQAQFGGIVYDPTNYASNVLQAARALQQINNQITQIQNQASSLINEARNLASLPLSTVDTLQQQVRQTQQLLGEAQRIAYNVQDIQQAFNGRYNGVNLTGTNAQMVANANARWEDSVGAFQDALQGQAGVVLIHVPMADDPALDLIRGLRSSWRSAVVIAIGTRASDEAEIRARAAGAGVDLVVHVQRTASGKREVAAIAEVVGHTGEAITVQSLFEVQQGDLVPTGFEPSFWPQISHLAPRFMPPGVVQ